MADVLRDTPGARDVVNPVQTDKIDLDIGLDEQKAALLNIPSGEPRRAIRLAISGERAASFRDQEGDNYPVTVRYPFEGNLPISVLEKIFVNTRAGDPVPLSQITSPRLTNVTPQIQRYQLERTVLVTAQVDFGEIPSTVNQRAVEKLEQIDFPEGYKWSLEANQRQLARPSVILVR